MDTLDRLRRSYTRWAAPAALATLACWAFRQWSPEPLVGRAVTDVVGPATFILAAVLALALPLVHRARFVHTVRDAAAVPMDVFLRFERFQYVLALGAVYPALAGYLLDVSRFHFSGAFLMALYAAYYHFPSRKRVDHEVRLFRVDEGGGARP